jgi:TolA-binding protein
LLEVVEGPRFRDFQSLPEYHGAELLLAGSYLERHALKSAQRVIDHVLLQGPDAAAFGPGYRRAVDIALARGDLAASATHLEGLVKVALPEDSANELRYLRARAAYDAQDFDRATSELKAITQKSRFYASAQYLLGAIAAKRKNYKEAEARFCAVTQAEKDNAFSFYVDGRFFPVRDLSHLGLGRVAHETGRAEDAFYYYFQVPNDSDKVAEAMFEAAWATYEGGDHDAALDSLDQLEARYPRSAHAAEAGVLRGYVHLARCEFAKAEQELRTFEKTFARVLVEIDRALHSGSRRESVYRDLVAREESIVRMRENAEQGEPTPNSVLLALVQADSEFYRLHSEIRALDAEIARTGNVPDQLEALAARVRGKDAPKPRLEGEASDVEALKSELVAARAAVDAFSRELSALWSAGKERDELNALRGVRQKLDTRIEQLEARLREALRKDEAAHARPASADLALRLVEDRAYVEELRRSARRVRTGLEDAADRAGEKALKEVRERLATELRRARIGRIDAVMGAKRTTELQVESLAAGRFPPELVDPLRMQSLLRDDEEYWPFEGEDWPDEFEERYSDQEEP